MQTSSSGAGELRLVSFPICPFVQRARILLDAKGVDHDIHYIDLADKPRWFLDRVPTGKVPALFVGDRTLFESNVITEYLDDTTGAPILPQEPLQRASEKAWIAYSDGLLMALFHALRADSLADYAAHKQALMDGIDKARNFVEPRVEDGYRFAAFEVAVAPLLLRIEQVPDIREMFWTRFDESSVFGDWARQVLAEDVLRTSVPDDFAEQFISFFRLDDPGHPAVAG